MFGVDEVIAGAKRRMASVMLKLEVINLLRSSAVNKIDFAYGRYAFQAKDYHDLATDIQFGRVGVVTDVLPAGTGAEYQQLPQTKHPNCMVFPLTWAAVGRDAWRRLTLIHEATHAIQDKRGKDLSEVNAESPAFVAAALFTIFDGGSHAMFDPIPKAKHYDEASVIFRRAWLAAHELLGPPKRTKVPARWVHSIDRAVDAHSLYSRRELYEFDGI